MENQDNNQEGIPGLKVHFIDSSCAVCVPTLVQASDLTAILFASAIHPISIFLFTNYCALHVNSKVTIRLQNCHPRNFLLQNQGIAVCQI